MLPQSLTIGSPCVQAADQRHRSYLRFSGPVGLGLMAPMAVYSSHPLKRTSSIAEFDTPAAKKLNRGPLRHHRPLWDLQREQRLNMLWQDQEAPQSMLTRSIGLALHAVGFEAADPVAIESFRCDVEECMHSSRAYWLCWKMLTF